MSHQKKNVINLAPPQELAHKNNKHNITQGSTSLSKKSESCRTDVLAVGFAEVKSVVIADDERVLQLLEQRGLLQRVDRVIGRHCGGDRARGGARTHARTHACTHARTHTRTQRTHTRNSRPPSNKIKYR